MSCEMYSRTTHPFSGHRGGRGLGHVYGFLNKTKHTSTRCADYKKYRTGSKCVVLSLRNPRLIEVSCTITTKSHVTPTTDNNQRRYPSETKQQHASHPYIPNRSDVLCSPWCTVYTTPSKVYQFCIKPFLRLRSRRRTPGDSHSQSTPRGALTPTHSGGVGDIVGCSSLSPSSSCPRNLHSAVHSALANLLPLISPVQENEARHNNALKSAGIIGAGEHNGSSSCPNRTPSDLLRSAQVAGHTTSGRQETRILRAPLGAL